MTLCRLFVLCLIIVPSLMTSGCLYLADTQQGNVIEPEQLEQLKVGQNQEQVRYLLGTPVIQDPLHPERWDYVFFFKDGESGEKVYERVTVVFDRGIVRQIAKGGEAITYQPAARSRVEPAGSQPVDLPLILDGELYQ